MLASEPVRNSQDEESYPQNFIYRSIVSHPSERKIALEVSTEITQAFSGVLIFTVIQMFSNEYSVHLTIIFICFRS